jgi:hypothetical protein
MPKLAEGKSGTASKVTDAVFDEATGRWVSRAEVAKIGFTAFSSRKHSGRNPAGWSCGASRHGVQPHPGRGHPHRQQCLREGHHRHDPAQSDQRAE